eukprot:5935460-Pyramimonas_sp.AAC.1
MLQTCEWTRFPSPLMRQNVEWLLDANAVSRDVAGSALVNHTLWRTKALGYLGLGMALASPQWNMMHYAARPPHEVPATCRS